MQSWLLLEVAARPEVTAADVCAAALKHRLVELERSHQETLMARDVQQANMHEQRARYVDKVLHAAC